MAGAADAMPRPPLDLAALAAWWPQAVGPVAGALRATRCPGGFSNLTFVVEDDAARWVVRRPPAGVGPGTAHDMVREHRVLRAVHPHFPLAPAPVAVCEDPAVLGAPFFVMAHVDGRILRGGGREAPLPPAEACAVGEAVVDTLAALHAVPVSDPALAALGRPEGYAARQVAQWGQRWARARTEPQPAVERAAAWLAAQEIPEAPPTVVHNDFKHDNLVVDPDRPSRVRAVLDWELATVGSPLLDLGTTLGYWIEPGDAEPLRRLGIGCTTWPGTPTRAAVVARYEARTGRAVPQPVWLYVFGLFKVAVIAQQLLARHRAGLSDDPRHGGLGAAVTALGEAALTAIASGRVTP